MLMLRINFKNKKYYFNIFLNKKHCETQLLLCSQIDINEWLITRTKPMAITEQLLPWGPAQ
jgi:hypothetical protein